MENFTPVSAAIGGFLLGLAAVLLMAVNGRLAGISGIVAGLLPPFAKDWGWRAGFVAGIVIAPVALWSASGERPDFDPAHPVWLTIIGGLLVGYGARMGSGCTSGHGVCGLARLSRRSLVATASFMGTAMATATALGWLGA